MNLKISKACILAFFVGLVSIPLAVRAQLEGISIVSAENYYIDKDYRNAFIGFEQYLVDVKYDRDVAYKAGISATRLGMGKKGIYYLKSAMKNGVNDNYLKFWLGRAFHMDVQLDSAEKYFYEYLDVFPIDKGFKKEAERFISSIAKAKERMFKTLQPIVIENMGNGINSVYSEYQPLLTHDGKMMVYASRKKGFAEEKLQDDGEYKEKIFYSRLLSDGKWSKGMPVRLTEGKNKDLDFNLIQLLDNDTKMLLYRIDQDVVKLYISEYSYENWKLPYAVPIVTDPSFFSADIIFSNDLKWACFTKNGSSNSFQNDLFTSRYDEKTEKWSEPVLLSKVICSPQDEAAPFFPDQKTLIFSSKSLDGFGDFDLYKSTLDENTQTWSKPENLGFPYNTPNNDFYYFWQPANPDVSYFASVRGSTKGQSDIYKVRKTALATGKGTISDETGKPLASASLLFEDPESFQSVKVNTDTEGNFTAELVAGQTYTVKFTNAQKVQLEKEIKIDFPVNPAQLESIQIQLVPRKMRSREEEMPGLFSE